MDGKGGMKPRLDRIRNMLAERQLDAVRLTLQKNISWLTGGRSHVNPLQEAACCQIVVSRDKCVLISNNIESRRLLEEEIGEANRRWFDAVEQWPWHEPGRLHTILARYLEGAAVRTDAELEAELFSLRTSFGAAEAETLRELGRLTAEAVEQAARDVMPGDTEFKMAGRLALRCYERELEPVVHLIAADERIWERRHPLPTGKPVSRYAMLVVCARKNGLIASATRLVHFGPVPADLRARHRAVTEIDARIIAATRPGESLSGLYGKLRDFYREAGYPDEIEHHHQGGLTGYATRERLATPDASLTVETGQMYAWNPSIAGAKSEDTILVLEEGNEILTHTGAWPMVEVEAGGRVWRRPDILVRQG